MKKIILAAILAVISFTIWAQTPDSLALQPVTVILDTFEIGGQEYYQIADLLDSTFTNVRLVVAQVKATNPQSWMDYLEIFLKLLTGGVITSLIAQGMRIFTKLKTSIKRLPRGEIPVLIASIVIGGVWLYLETKFIAFSFEGLFYRTAGVFTIAVVAWRLGLSKIFAKPGQAKNITDEKVKHLVVELQSKGIIGPLPSELNQDV